MNHSPKYYLGIDVSKLWFDLTLMVVTDHHTQPMTSERFDNDGVGLKAFGKWLKAHHVPFDQHSLVVIENTGVYHRLIWGFCSTHHLPIHIGNAAQIKWSLGITRGKSDKTDSQRLCSYAHKHHQELSATPVLDPVLLELKDLISARTSLLTKLGGIKVYLSELRPTIDKGVQKIIEKAHKAAIEGLEQSIELLEIRISDIIKADDAMKVSYDLLVTVPGIGHLTAVYLIGCTANFSGGINGKQLASYAGVVPFSDKSGSSIKGRAKVHPMANKELKRMLHLCAMSAIRVYPEFRAYYDRKKGEGKHSMTVLNAIRNKIALRAMAVIKKGQPYVDNFKAAA